MVRILKEKQWKINLTNKGTLYEYSPMFNAEATMDNDRMEFFQITPTLGGDKKSLDFLWNWEISKDSKVLGPQLKIGCMA